MIVKREKKNGKTQNFDLSDELLTLEQVDPEALRMTLVIGGNRASVRPEEVLQEIFGEVTPELSLVREDLLVDWNRRWVNPLLAASAPHAG